MNANPSPQADPLPHARAARRRWRFPWVWVVPVVSMLVAGYLVYTHVREYGPTLSIRFATATGLVSGQTPVRFRGADIGQVSDITISEDEQHADVKVKLKRNASELARQGSIFWIVRPQVGLGNLSGLETIVSGPYIEVLPGKGKRATQFRGVGTSPSDIDPQGLTLVLLAEDAGSLRAGVPVYYRGIQVGAVSDTRLDPIATAVDIVVVIRHPYAVLVHQESKFWNVSGLDVRLGLFHGAELNVESLKSLLIGGIAFATPDSNEANRAGQGTVFRLYSQPEKQWLAWTPQIQVQPEANEVFQTDTTAQGNVPYPGPNPAGALQLSRHP